MQAKARSIDFNLTQIRDFGAAQRLRMGGRKHKGASIVQLYMNSTQRIPNRCSQRATRQQPRTLVCGFVEIFFRD